jgi:hypothetical protein
MKYRKYWNKENTTEFFALVSSIAFIWSSTIKTLPTIILFNIVWSVLVIFAIIKYWIQS